MYIKINIFILISFAFSFFCISEESESNIEIINLSASNTDTITFKEFIDEIKDNRIIYIGENHDNKSHHEIQLKIIKKLYTFNPRIVIGMEMFQSQFQNEINKYINCKINEEEFLGLTEYKKRWVYDYGLYKPIIDFAKEENIPVIALSIDSEVTREISRHGISGLEAKLLNQLPTFIDFTNNDYGNFLFDIFEQHPESENKDFSRFHEVQLVWDESMAENIVRLSKNINDYQLIVLSGNGHIVFDYGIPSRAFRRNNIKFVTVTIDVEKDNGISDYIIQSPR